MSDAMDGPNVDAVYRGLLDGFGPAVKQLSMAGRNYFRALQGLGATSKAYADALNRIASVAQRSYASADIAQALTDMAAVAKELSASEDEFIAFFNEDFLSPVESNVSQDAKVITEAMKNYDKNQKVLFADYRKKDQNYAKRNGKIGDEQLAQDAHESKLKLDQYRGKQLQEAIEEERKRYGFILERHCALVDRTLPRIYKTKELFEKNMPNWARVAMFDYAVDQSYVPTQNGAFMGNQPYVTEPLREHTLATTAPMMDSYNATSETTPKTYEQPARRQESSESESNVHNRLNEDERALRLIDEQFVFHENETPMPRRQQQYMAAIHAYTAQEENQLTFSDGDLIQVIQDGQKGWKYGENLRTNRRGWFPSAYTQPTAYDDNASRDSYQPEPEPRVVHRPSTNGVLTNGSFNSGPLYERQSNIIYENMSADSDVVHRREEPKPVPAPAPAPAVVHEERRQISKSEEVQRTLAWQAHQHQQSLKRRDEEVVVTPKKHVHATNFDTIPKNNPWLDQVKLRKIVDPEGVPKKYI